MKLNLPKNKWFYAFVITLAVLVVAAVVGVIVGVIASRPPEYVEGDEVGVYYYDVEGGEVVLTLSGGYNFTLAGPGINKTGTYKLDEENPGTYILDFFKEDDGTTTLTVNGDKMALVYGNATMLMQKKVEYTVSFNTDGGSAIEAVKVINGKTVARPADPAKENAVFLGWYADEALTTPYAFDTTLVTGNATVYAKWAYRTVGVAEYTVDFDLGYEGAVAPEAMTTISGKLYGVPTDMKREGYTFGGWWVSMYEDAAKLTYAYTEDTVFTANTTLFAVWHDDASTKLNAPAVSVTGNMITWTPVQGATAGYTLTVTTANGVVVIEENLAATTKAFDFGALNAGEYIVSVVAKANNADNNSEPAVRHYANKTLDRVADFQVVNGILVFGAVKNAEKYIITVDCGDDGHIHTAFDNGSSTVYYLAGCPMQEGGILITVTAMANGYASSVSETYVYDLTLDAIESVEYNKATDTFVWNAVPFATNYIVTVKVGENTYTYDNGTFTSFSAAAFTGNITVSVVPATKGYNSPAAAEATCEKTAPAMPNGLSIMGNILTWNAVEGAVSYEIKIDDQVKTATTNTLDFTAVGFALSQGRVYKVQVKAVDANNNSSAYSAALEFGYYTMPDTLVYSKNTVTWAPVLGINQFSVRVNGGYETIYTDVTSAPITLTHAGENLIEVRYVNGEEATEWVSVTVFAHTVEYNTRSPFSGTLFEYLAVGDVMTFPEAGVLYDGYNFAYWSNTPAGVAGNGFVYEEGCIFDGNAYTVVYATWTPKDYTVHFDMAGVSVEIDNMQTGDTATVTYTKPFTLPVPTISSATYVNFVFSGWYTDKGGKGIQITDSTGASLVPYNYTRDLTLYPHFGSDALKFTLETSGEYEGMYVVSAGTSIADVVDLVIPAYYNELPVAAIKESGFTTARNLRTVKIPDTIKLVGVNAFRNANKLASIEVYKAEEGDYEVFYFSENDSLLRNDYGVIYLEVVPAAVTGDYIIPDTVQKILPGAFRNTQITSVTIPNTLMTVPAESFNNCKELKEIIFEGNRTAPIELTISEDGTKGPFTSCNKVESLVLPKDINLTLAEMKTMLSGLGGLRSIEIEAGGTVYASKGSMLTNAVGDTIVYCPKGYTGAITIPNGISTIGDRAFQDCDNITEVVIPMFVTEIKEYAFYSMSGVTKVTFKGGRSDALTVGRGAFEVSNNIKEIVFEGNGTNPAEGEEPEYDAAITFGESVFATSFAKTDLQTVTVKAGAKITAFGTKMFYKQSKLHTVSVDPNAYVGAISAQAFEGCTALSSVEIPATVTSVAARAFAECTALAKLTFAPGGDADLDIQDKAFIDCSMLRTIHLPARLDKFQSSVFLGCDALTQLFVDEGSKNFASDESGILFRKNTDADGKIIFTELLFYPAARAAEKNGIVDDLPSTVTVIGGSSFANVTTLKKIVLPAGVKAIDLAAFKGCENLEMIVFLGAENPAEGAKLTIGEQAFYGTGALSGDIVWPDYITSLGKNAFAYSKIEKFVAPAGLTSLPIGLFAKCEHLVEVDLTPATKLTTLTSSANTATTGGPFWHCYGLKTVKLPASVTNIMKYSFKDCYALETVMIGTYTVTEVNGQKVYDVNSNLVSIGNNAFENCYSLQSIVLPNTVTAIGSSCFLNTATNPGQMTELGFEMGGTEVLNIGTNAFQNQALLVSVTFPARTRLPSAITDTKVKDANGNATSQAPTLAQFNNQNKANNVANCFKGCDSLAEINYAVEEGIDPIYTSLNGALYTPDMSLLIFVPAANVGGYKDGNPTYEFIVPDSVQVVMGRAFENCNKLLTVTFAEHETGSAYADKTLIMSNYAFTAKTYAMFGTSTSITTVNMPKHLAKVNGFAFAVSATEHPVMTINFNPDTPAFEVANHGFRASAVQTITIPSVSKLGTDTFEDSTNLVEVVIAKYATSITALPNNMFKNCPKFTTYELPGKDTKVTKLGTYTFQNCTSLTSITIPTNITNLGNYSFQNTGFTTFTMPSHVSTMGTYLFKGCLALTEVVFQKSSVSISQNMFEGCTALTTIDFSNITSVGNNAFKGCTSLNVDFTKATNLSSIGTASFQQTAITVVDLRNTQVSQLNNAFQNIETLTKFYYPNTFTGYANGANGVVFAGVPNLTYIDVGTGFKQSHILVNLSSGKVTASTTFFLEYVWATNPDAEVIFPATVNENMDEYGVIYDDLENPQTVIWVCPSTVLEEYTIKEGTMTISSWAFAYTHIKSIIIPASVQVVDRNAFYGAFSTSITVVDTPQTPSQMTTIGGTAFAYSHIEIFTVPDSVTELTSMVGSTTYGNPFGWCPNLKTLILGASITEINYAKGLALGTTSLETLELQEGITELGPIFATSYDRVQDAGHKLTYIKVPDTVTKIYGAFNGMDGLVTVEFGANSKLENIEAFSFMDCASLERFVAPASLGYIGNSAFMNCTSLEYLDLSATGIREIWEYTFYNNESLAEVKFPSELTTLSHGAFYNSGIVDLVIPAKVTTFGYSVFENSTKMESVTFDAASQLAVLDATALALEDANARNAGQMLIKSNTYNTVAASTFRGCTSLTTVTLPNSLTTIGDRVFENTAISEINFTLPEQRSKLSTIGNYAFRGTNFETLDFSLMAGVTSIGDGAFMECENLKTVAFGAEISHIGGMAFAFCPELETGYIPTSVLTLGGNPYAGMSGDKLEVPEGAMGALLEVDDNGVYTLYDVYKGTVYGVYGATGTYTISVSKKAPIYAMGALAGTAITDIHIPYDADKLTTVPAYMFMNCEQLTNVTFDAAITGIGDYAFAGSGLTSFEVPAKVTKIGHYAFYQSNIQTLTFAEHASDIIVGDYAFADCDQLVSAVIPYRVTRFGNYAFAYCDLLANFVIEPFTGTGSNNGTEIGTHFLYNCPNITQVALPSSIKANMVDLAANFIYTGGGNYNYLPSYMFAGTGITHAVITCNVQNFMTEGVFANCENLVRVSYTKAYSASVDEINHRMFMGCDKYDGTFEWGYTA